MELWELVGKDLGGAWDNLATGVNSELESTIGNITGD